MKTQKMFKSFLIATFLATTLSSSALAFEIHTPEKFTTQHIDGNTGILEISGTIDKEAAIEAENAFYSFYENSVNRIVINLDSLGGHLSSGKRIINNIKEAEAKGIQVVTYVGHKKICASMCTGIFAVGNTRYAARDSSWIFHSPYVDVNNADKTDPFEMQRINDSISNARDFMLTTYSEADPYWTKLELKSHVVIPEYPLMLSGEEILDHSRSWITEPIGEQND